MTQLPPAAPSSHWQPVLDHKGQPSAFWEHLRSPEGMMLNVTRPVERATLAAYQALAWIDEAESNHTLMASHAAYEIADDWQAVRMSAMKEARA